MNPGFTIRARPGPLPALAPLSRALSGAAEDVDRRARAIGLPVTGGEIVLSDLEDATLSRLARALDDLGGRVVAIPGRAVPFGVFRALAEKTRHVAGIASGDPSPHTARGVIHAIRAFLPIEGTVVAIFGAGRVGGHLARFLAEEKARVLVADLDPDRARDVAFDVGGTAFDPEELLDRPCDVFSPNARGTTITVDVATRLRCQVVAGGANRPFAPDAIDVLRSRGITVVPEEIAGSGWLGALAAELPPLA